MATLRAGLQADIEQKLVKGAKKKMGRGKREA
jgi:hypothetical protein